MYPYCLSCIHLRWLFRSRLWSPAKGEEPALSFPACFLFLPTPFPRASPSSSSWSALFASALLCESALRSACSDGEGHQQSRGPHLWSSVGADVGGLCGTGWRKPSRSHRRRTTQHQPNPPPRLAGACARTPTFHAGSLRTAVEGADTLWRVSMPRRIFAGATHARRWMRSRSGDPGAGPTPSARVESACATGIPLPAFRCGKTMATRPNGPRSGCASSRQCSRHALPAEPGVRTQACCMGAFLALSDEQERQRKNETLRLMTPLVSSRQHLSGA